MPTTIRSWLLALLMLMTAGAQAGINYGNFLGSNVQFLNVTEDSGTDPLPLFGPPIVVADTLDFNPTSFNSLSSGPFGVDITDGTLGFFVEALPGHFLDALVIKEAGDVTLAGFGGPGTVAAVFTSVFVNILEVDGVGVTPINLIGTLAFTPSAGDYDLLTDAGGGPFYNTIWTGVLTIDLTDALTNSGVPFDLGVTKIGVVLDNTLLTVSELGTSSFIAKKNVQISIVPEATSVLMVSLAMGGLVLHRYGRRYAFGNRCQRNPDSR